MCLFILSKVRNPDMCRYRASMMRRLAPHCLPSGAYPVGARPAEDELWGGVSEGAGDHVHGRLINVRQDLGEADVADLGDALLRQQDVGRLQVPAGSCQRSFNACLLGCIVCYTVCNTVSLTTEASAGCCWLRRISSLRPRASLDDRASFTCTAWTVTARKPAHVIY